MINLDELDEETFKAIKKLVKGFCLKEVINEYVLDDNGNKQLSKQKISKKLVPPNTDILKMLFNKTDTSATNFENWSDAELEKSAVKWKVSRMARVTRSILRLAVYELLHAENSIPPKAVINEAVELAKEFDDDAAPAFINGILNKIARDNGKLGEAETAPEETV